MTNCFGFGGNDNGCLWILIILLILCCCGGTLDGIFNKLCNCECLIPLILVWFCCCNKGGRDGGYIGGCCK